MKFRRRTQDTPHPSNITLEFRVAWDFTDDGMLTLNGIDISETRNKRSSSYVLSQATAVSQPRRNGKEAWWDDDTGNLQHMIAGSDYLFFDAADTDGAFIFALLRSNRVAGDNLPYAFDFGDTGADGWGFRYSSNEMVGYTPIAYGGVATTAFPLATSTAYRSVGFVVEFGSIQRFLIDNSEVASDPITLLDLRDAYITNAPTRQLNSGPVTIGLTSKTASQTNRSFRDGAMRSILIGAGIPSAYQRDLIQKYHNAKKAA